MIETAKIVDSSHAEYFRKSLAVSDKAINTTMLKARTMMAGIRTVQVQNRQV
jgi:hypothetical protein